MFFVRGDDATDHFGHMFERSFPHSSGDRTQIHIVYHQVALVISNIGLREATENSVWLKGLKELPIMLTYDPNLN